MCLSLMIAPSGSTVGPGRSNQDIADGIQTVINAMVIAAQRRGLTINFEDGKAEALWDIVGKGSKDWKMQLATAASTLTWKSQGQERHRAIRIVHAYRHLGTWLQVGHTHGKEIQHRSSQAQSSWGALAIGLFTTSRMCRRGRRQRSSNPPP